MEKIAYFDKPTQVYFCNEEGEWKGGIAYCGEVICGCCGSIFEIEELYENAPKNIENPILTYSYWVNISDEIIGGELPNSWTESVN